MHQLHSITCRDQQYPCYIQSHTSQDINIHYTLKSPWLLQAETIQKANGILSVLNAYQFQEIYGTPIREGSQELFHHHIRS